MPSFQHYSYLRGMGARCPSCDVLRKAEEYDGELCRGCALASRTKADRAARAKASMVQRSRRTYLRHKERYKAATRERIYKVRRSERGRAEIIAKRHKERTGEDVSGVRVLALSGYSLHWQGWVEGGCQRDDAPEIVGSGESLRVVTAKLARLIRSRERVKERKTAKKRKEEKTISL